MEPLLWLGIILFGLSLGIFIGIKISKLWKKVNQLSKK